MKTYLPRALKTILFSTCIIASASLKLSGQTQAFTSPRTWSQWAVTDAGDQYASDVAIDGNGYAYTVGFFKSVTTDFSTPNPVPLSNSDASGLTEDGYLTCYDTSSLVGLLWRVRVSSGVGATYSNDRCNGVSTLPDGFGGYHIYVVGWYTGTAFFQSTSGPTLTLNSNTGGGQNAYLACYNQNGVALWVADISGSGTNTADYAYRVSASVDLNNGLKSVYVVGRNGSGSDNAKTFSANDSRGPTYTSIHVSAGFPINSPPANDDGYLVKYVDGNTYGQPIWMRSMGSANADVYYGVASSQGSVSVCGQYKGAGMTVEGNATTFGLNGLADIIVANYSNLGVYKWSKQLGGNGASTNENATCVTMDPNGDTYAAGFYGGTGSSFSCTASGMQSFVTKISSTGTTLWSKCSSGAAGDDYVGGIAVDRCSKHVFVGGSFKANTFVFGSLNLNAISSANNDNFLFELDASNGNNLLDHNAQVIGQVFGSGGNDVLYGLSTDRLDRVYIAGVANGNFQFSNFQSVNLPVLFNTGGYDGYLLRYNECIWPATSDCIVVNGGQSEHMGISIDQCQAYCFGTMFGDNSFGGNFISSTWNPYQAQPSNDIYLTTCDRYGYYNGFTRVATGTADEYVTDQAMDATHSNFYISGYALAAYSGMTIVTNTTTTYATGNQPAIFCKTNLSGVPLWTGFLSTNNPMGGASAYATAVDNIHGYVYFCGTFEGSVKDDLGNIFNTAANHTDAFLAKYTTAGTLVWVKDITSTNSTTSAQVSANGLSIDQSSGDVYITGAFNATTTWYGSSNINITSAGGNSNLYVAKYNSNGQIQKVLTYPHATSQGTRLVVESSTGIYVVGNYLATGGGAFVDKCDFSGTNPIWSWVNPVIGLNAEADALTTDHGNLYVTGCGGGSNPVTFGSFTIFTNGNSYGIYIAKLLKTNGTVLCLGDANNKTGSIGPVISRGITEDSYTGNLYIAGLGGNGPCSANLYSFIQEFSSDNCDYADRHGNPNSENTETISNADNTTRVSIYPNPIHDQATLKISGEFNSDIPASLIIMDMTGRIVKRTDGITKQETPIESGNLESGIYLFEVLQNGNKIGEGKFIITK